MKLMTGTATAVCARSTSYRASNAAVGLGGTTQSYDDVGFGGMTMKILKHLMWSRSWQELIEYTLIVLLLAFTFWVALNGKTVSSRTMPVGCSAPCG
jgi:hypothetical protein